MSASNEREVVTDMLYEFALTAGIFDQFPQVSQPITNQALVQVLYGVRQNGLLANLYNGSWWAEVKRKQNGLPFEIRRLIVELLSQLWDRGLIIHRAKQLGRCPQSDAEWLEEALASHEQMAMHSIVTRKSTMDRRTGLPACVLPLEEILLHRLWNERRKTRRIARTQTNFEDALAPILSTARSVDLIDPHLAFRVYRGNLEFLRTLTLLDECAAPGSRRCSLSRFRIHTEDHDEIPADQYDRVVRQIKDAMPGVTQCNARRGFYAWRSRPNGKPFHNRRILTNHAGLSCPWGLDIHEGPNTTPGDDEWSLLDYEDRVAIAEDFQENSSPYDLIEELRW